MQEQLSDFVAMLTQMLNGDQAALDAFGDAPVDTVEAQTSDVAAADIDPVQMLAEALAASDLDAGQQAAVMGAVDEAVNGYGAPEGGYSPEQLATIFAQGINVTVEEGDKINVDNSLYVEGDVKGGIHQANETNITDADDGAVIATGAEGSNFQTGEGNTQIDDTYADNITSGDGNTVASGGSTIGNENVDAYSIEDSEFGEGDQDRSVEVDAKITDSFTDDDNVTKHYSDDDNVHTDIDIDVKEGHGYEPVEQVHYDHEPHHDHHEDEVYD
ncbi:MAG: hypothetical protein AAGD35_13735 [Actinomycetota bacterium]